MTDILTADQFVVGVVAALKLKGESGFRIEESSLDRCFEKAFELLIESSDPNRVVPNFSFYVDPLHGDCVALREALLAARDKGIVALNNPTFHFCQITLSEERAGRYLKDLPLPVEFFRNVVEKCFPRTTAVPSL